MGRVMLLGNEDPSLVTTTVGEDGGPLHGLGRSVDGFSCGREFFFAEICPPEPDTADLEDSPFGYKARPFAVAARQKLPTRCEPGQGADELQRAFAGSAEYQFGRVLWFGDDNWKIGSGDDFTDLLYLTSGAVPTTVITGDADPRRDIADVLFDACEANPDLRPVLHLGMYTAMRAGTDGLGTLNVPYVVNPAYPVDGIAVTGMIHSFVGSVQDLTHVDWPRNRRYAEATRLGLIEFDPCRARIGVTGS